MLVYLWARKHRLIILREEFPARSWKPNWIGNPISPTAGGKCPPPLPQRKALPGLRQSPGAPPDPSAAAGGGRGTPNGALLPLRLFLLGVHTDTGGSGTLPHTAVTWQGSLLGGRGGERKQPFSPFSFVCNWDRLQAQSLKSLLRCFRAKVNSPHH